MVVVSGLAFGIDACAHRGALETGPHGRRPRLRRRRRLSGRPPLALAAGPGERPRPLRAAAGDRGLALDLPGPQPDDGRPGGDDGGRRGGGALRLADHRRPRRGPGPRPRRRARPGQLAGLGRAEQPAGRRRLPGPRRPGRARRDARAGASGASGAVGPAARRRSPPRRWRRSSSARTPATRSPPPSTSSAPRPPPRSPTSRPAATSPARCSASTRGRCCQPAGRSDHLG